MRRSARTVSKFRNPSEPLRWPKTDPVYHRMNGLFEATALKSEEIPAMTPPPRKMSEVMKEMAERLLLNPDAEHSSEAMHVALFFANAAWNESVGIAGAREGYRNVWETIEAENPELWNEFKSNDIAAMIDDLIRFKQAHHPNDRRRILTCGIPDGRIRVEWLNAAAPGVDSKWEMRLYGLVRTGKRGEAIHFLQETRKMTRTEASKRVSEIAVELGLK